MEEEGKRKTALIRHKSIFEFFFILKGLTNSRSFFQELITHVLGNLCHRVGYLDDIVVLSFSSRDHIHHLAEVFDRLRNLR